MDGRAIESFDAAHRLGEAMLSIRGHKVSAAELQLVLGNTCKLETR